MINITDLLGITGNTFLIVEVTLIVFVFLIQFYFFFRTTGEINILKNTFTEILELSSKLTSTNGDVENEETNSYSYKNVVQLESSSKNPIQLKIKESINNYLLHNHGSTINYSIIKDIIERELDAKNEAITQTIPIPLYLGLSATIIGIIFGLFAMPDLSQEGVNLAAIGPLITGVKIAMFATLSGLLWTILLSSMVYTRALKGVLNDKNRQLNYLQEILLPELYKAEDAGVIGLKASIDNFSRHSSKIVTELHAATKNSKENILAQQLTLDRIERLNVTKISKVNLELFDRLHVNMAAFNKFSEFIDYLGEISSNLQQFSLRTSDIDSVIKEIKGVVIQSKELNTFLANHLQKIESMGKDALYSVDLAEKGFKDAIELLTSSTKENIESIGSISDTIEHNLNDITQTLFRKLEEAAKLYVDEITDIYSDSIPRFEHLDHLTELSAIKMQLEHATNGSITTIPEISGKLNQLEVVNKRLAEMNKLLNAVEKNTKNLKNLKVTERSGISKSFRDFLEWLKSFFIKS